MNTPLFTSNVNLGVTFNTLQVLKSGSTPPLYVFPFTCTLEMVLNETNHIRQNHGVWHRLLVNWHITFHWIYEIYEFENKYSLGSRLNRIWEHSLCLVGSVALKGKHHCDKTLEKLNL